MIGGFVPARKSPGMGSSELVGKLKHTLKEKVGHTGTLDRFAAGLMILVVGRATSLSDFFLHADKRYIAEFRFGKSTESHDPEGPLIEERGAEESTRFVADRSEEIRSWIEDQVQVTEQTPPLYSALKKDGRRYSDHARKGVTELPLPRKVQIHSAVVLSISGTDVKAEFSVSGGTYIRSIARDLGQAFSFPVHLHSLLRTALGSFTLDDSAWEPGKTPVILPPHDVLRWPRIQANTAQVREIIQGHRPRLSVPEEGQFAWVVDEKGQPAAWIELDRFGLYKVRRVFQ
jgi:tRNA pseudouridine55 synthase